MIKKIVIKMPTDRACEIDFTGVGKLLADLVKFQDEWNKKVREMENE